MTSPLNIAVVAACPFPCERGTPIRIHRLSEALSRRGHRVHVVTYHFGDDNSGFPFAVHRTRNLPFYRRRAAGPTYTKLLLLDPLLVGCLRHVLRNCDIDVVHAHHLEGLLAALAARRKGGPPIVYDAHTLLGAELPFYNMALPPAFKRWLARVLDQRLPRRADHVVAVTQAIRDHLVEAGACAGEGITVATNGVEIERFAMAPSVIPDFESGSELLAYAGNLSAYQGIGQMLKALEIVRRTRPRVRLVVVTDNPTEELRRMAAEIGVSEGLIVVQGGFEKVPGILQAADVLLNPRPECPGIPQKLLNYMAACKPIVSFAGSGQVLEHCRSGWLVEGDQPAALAEGILKVLTDSALAARLAAGARSDVEARFSWDGAAARLESVFTAVLGDSQGTIRR